MFSLNKVKEYLQCGVSFGQFKFAFYLYVLIYLFLIRSEFSILRIATIRKRLR